MTTSVTKVNGELPFKEPKLIALTLEEAKRVQNALYELLRNSNDKNSKEWLTYWMINERVEQVEMSKQSTLGK